MRKVGRPKTTHCKRGHERKPDEPACVACRRYRERLKYDMDAAFRAKKRTYQSRWRKEFFAKNGFWASALYERRAA